MLACSTACASVLLDCVPRVFCRSRQGMRSVLQTKRFEMFVRGYGDRSVTELGGKDRPAMTRHKVLAIGLDGLDANLAERLMVEGEMPALADLIKSSARFLLDEGPARRTGLPWEHVASGLSPEAARRWGQIEFDPISYTALKVLQQRARDCTIPMCRELADAAGIPWTPNMFDVRPRYVAGHRRMT